MKKLMEPVTVETTKEGQILIRQDDIGDGEPVVMIEPSQVPVLVKWLEAAAAELEQAN